MFCCCILFYSIYSIFIHTVLLWSTLHYSIQFYFRLYSAVAFYFNLCHSVCSTLHYSIQFYFLFNSAVIFKFILFHSACSNLRYSIQFDFLLYSAVAFFFIQGHTVFLDSVISCHFIAFFFYFIVWALLSAVLCNSILRFVFNCILFHCSALFCSFQTTLKDWAVAAGKELKLNELTDACFSFNRRNLLFFYFQRTSAWWITEIPVVRFAIWHLTLTLHYELSVVGHAHSLVWLDDAAITAWINLGGVHHVKRCHVAPGVHWLRVFHRSLSACDTLRRTTGSSDTPVIIQ